MSDEPVSAPAKPKKKATTLLVVIGLMLVEGGGIYGAMKMFGSGPKPSPAAENADAEKGPVSEPVTEILVAETDAFNKLTGRLFMYHIQVFAVVEEKKRSAFEAILEERKATIEDRITTVIRSADPAHLAEPGLETLRRQFKFELDKVTEDETLVQKVLIPKLLQSRSSL